MPGGVLTLASGVQDAAGTPALSKVTANMRVRTSTGTISLVTDVLQFNGATSTVGNFLMGMGRVTINGIPAIHATSAAQSVLTTVPPSPAPCVITTTDPRVSGS